jgi:hypothetical protein
MKTVYNETKLIDMYLDYKNNYLTLELFAEHYQIDIDKAIIIVNSGKHIYNVLSVLNV